MPDSLAARVRNTFFVLLIGCCGTERKSGASVISATKERLRSSSSLALDVYSVGVDLCKSSMVATCWKWGPALVADQKLAS